MSGVLYLGDRVEWLGPGALHPDEPKPTGVLVAMDTGAFGRCAKVRWDAPLYGHHDEDHKSYGDLRKVR